MEDGKVYIGLEIGGSKIAAVAGIQEESKMKILAFSERQVSLSDEVLRFGNVQNGEITSSLINEVIDNVIEKGENNEYELDLESVNLNISNLSINTKIERAKVACPQGVKKIRTEDVDSLLNSVLMGFSEPSGHTTLHCIPKDFYVNDELTTGMLVGKFGNHLRGDFTFITSDSRYLDNLVECVNHVEAKGGATGNLKVENVYLNQIADSNSLLGNTSEGFEAKKNGVAIVNIGASFTQIAVFQNHSLRHFALIPIAGNTINNDLMKAFGITFEEAEVLKIVCGGLPITYETSPIVEIEKKYGMKPVEIFLKNAALVVEWRLKEIAVMVKAELAKQGISRLPQGIILTGGTSNFPGIKDIFESVDKNMNIRAADFSPSVDFNGFNQLQNPKYSTLLGLIITPTVEFDKRVGQNNRILNPKIVNNQPAQPEKSEDKTNTGTGKGLIKTFTDLFRKNASDLNDKYNLEF